MTLNAIERYDNGYLISGTTRIGRPIQITINEALSEFEVNVEPFEGSSHEEPFIEVELQYVLAERDGVTDRINQILTSHPEITTGQTLSAIASLIDRNGITPDQIDKMFSGSKNIETKKEPAMKLTIPLLYTVTGTLKGSNVNQEHLVYENINFEVLNLDEIEAPIATSFFDHQDNKEEVTRWFDGSHYKKVSIDEQPSVEDIFSDLSKGIDTFGIVRDIRNPENKAREFTDSTFRMHNENERYNNLKKAKAGVNLLIVEDGIWVKCKEPVYLLYNLHVIHGHLAASLMEKNEYFSHEIYSALQWEDICLRASELGIQLQDDEVAPIQVHIPESIQLSSETFALERYAQRVFNNLTPIAQLTPNILHDIGNALNAYGSFKSTNGFDSGMALIDAFESLGKHSIYEQKLSDLQKIRSRWTNQAITIDDNFLQSDYNPR